MAYVGALMQLTWIYYVGLVLAGLLILYHFILIKNREPARCFKAFLHNNWVGAAIFAGIFINFL
jgi:4-hydroxybenzoate polyprenyltransferase